MTKIKLGDFEVTLNGQLPSVGSQLPDFLLADENLSNMTLNDFKGKKLVLNIFPSMNTPVCSASVVKFNQLASSFENTVVLCISRDLAFGHKQFCINNNIENVVFLSDMRSENFANNLLDRSVSLLLASFQDVRECYYNLEDHTQTKLDAFIHKDQGTVFLWIARLSGFIRPLWLIVLGS